MVIRIVARPRLLRIKRVVQTLKYNATAWHAFLSRVAPIAGMLARQTWRGAGAAWNSDPREGSWGR